MFCSSESECNEIEAALVSSAYAQFLLAKLAKYARHNNDTMILMLKSSTQLQPANACDM